MSECIVRMKIPKSCWDCPCFDDYGDYPRCEITNEQRGYNFPIHEKRMPNCPIICQLPEGHGELIERSKLFDWYTGQRTKYPVKQDSPQFDTRMMYEIFGEIDDAPTIVPAERSKK